MLKWREAYIYMYFLYFDIKGQQDLQEVVEAWAQAPHIMSKHFKEAIKERPKDFMSKFLQGQDWVLYISFLEICRFCTIIQSDHEQNNSAEYKKDYSNISGMHFPIPD